MWGGRGGEVLAEFQGRSKAPAGGGTSVPEAASIFEFGPFRVDARRRLVWRGGERLFVPVPLG